MTKSKNYRVYVVEDDLELSTIMERVLKKIDARVELDWATSAEEAVHHLSEMNRQTEQTPYDLIVADIFLEGETTGLDLWRLCQQEYPDIPLLVTSSISEDRLMAAVGRNSICPPFLAKPFSIAECTQIMGEMLNQG